jgi:hypothetical protein
MTAGLPGTGIGGLFYLLASLGMPLRFAWMRSRGHGDRDHRALVLRTLAMSLAMMAAVWLTGVLLGLWRPVPTIIAVAPIVVAFTTLVTILVAVEIVRLLLRPPVGFGSSLPSRREAIERRASDGPAFPRLRHAPDGVTLTDRCRYDGATELGRKLPTSVGAPRGFSDGQPSHPVPPRARSR